ncbi:ATP-binding protein [Massilia orientalis]|uniref:ATP-binding protein n=1 Tax=Massilia orientalis TaxID=3050128 RepID=A0ACC7M4M0_9BURK|nr:sensor histidine kinase [Massilia sp. YIM B02787]
MNRTTVPNEPACAPPAPLDAGAAASEPHIAACRRAWQLLCAAGMPTLADAPVLAADPLLANALQDAFNAGRLPGALIEAEIRRALLDGPRDATLLAAVLLAAVALDRFRGGRRAMLLADACAVRARHDDARAVAGAVLRAHATLILSRCAPLREAALLQAEACRLEAGRPDTLARNAVLWTGVRLLCGAPLAELLHYADAVRQSVPFGNVSVATSQLDSRIALFRMLADGPRTPYLPTVPADAMQFGCWLGSLQAAWLRGDTGAARAALAAARQLVTPLTPPCELLPYHLFGALTLARLDHVPGATAALRVHRRALQAWARRAPDVAGAMAPLALAVEQDAAGAGRALTAYERAAAQAQSAGQAWIAALAWEGAAGLCARNGLAGALPGYRKLALDAWRDWGAHGRVRDLMQAWDATPAAPDHDQQTRAARAGTVGELGITIAHEVNQPLAAILLHAAAARRWLRRGQPDTTRALEALEQITACGRQAGDIVRSVRGLARREGEAASMFALDTAVGEVAQLLRALMVRQNVQLETRLLLPERQIHASRAQIQQVLINLLLNAIEALACVSDRPRRIVLESVPAGPALVELRVRDNGPGIAPADRERIFDALYSTKPHGTGVGLSISRAIVEAHGGRIEYTAAEPHGALFRVVLPVRSIASVVPPSESRDHA